MFNINKGDVRHIGDGQHNGTDIYFSLSCGKWVFVNLEDMLLTKTVDRFIVVTTLTNNEDDIFLEEDKSNALALDLDGRGLMALEIESTEEGKEYDCIYRVLFDSGALD